MLFNNFEMKAMQSGLDALWLKQKVHAHNISNYETPGYKAQEIQFQDVLKGASKENRNQEKHEFKAEITTNENTSMRPDGNNVSMEKENTELWRAYAQYSYLTQKISGQFKNMRYVIGQVGK